MNQRHRRQLVMAHTYLIVGRNRMNSKGGCVRGDTISLWSRLPPFKGASRERSPRGGVRLTLMGHRSYCRDW
jgi:hypothetical protein